jgi:hypothetical protein
MEVFWFGFLWCEGAWVVQFRGFVGPEGIGDDGGSDFDLFFTVP